MQKHSCLPVRSYLTLTLNLEQASQKKKKNRICQAYIEGFSLKGIAKRFMWWLWPRSYLFVLCCQVVMDFRHPDGRHVPVYLPARSLLVMSGESRYVWSHGWVFVSVSGRHVLCILSKTFCVVSVLKPRYCDPITWWTFLATRKLLFTTYIEIKHFQMESRWDLLWCVLTKQWF